MNVRIPLHQPLFRGARRLRIAVVGLPGAGVSTILRGIASTGGGCDVDIGFDQARVGRGDPADADVVIQVLDATMLEKHLPLTLELLRRGRPLVLAVNKMDAARALKLHVATSVLARRLGVTAVPTIGARGYGIRELFRAAADAARVAAPRPPEEPAEQLVARLAAAATRPGGVHERRDWRFWADELFLSPRWGLFGSGLIFAAVLFVVFGVSARIDALSTAPLAEWVSGWRPETMAGVLSRAVADGLVGLAGIVVPYMVPLLMLLVALEQTGIMARVGFALDQVLHRVGLHGDVALPLLLGLGCNVPAISAIGGVRRPRERTIGALLITFVPCSARSAIILAVAGKTLGPWGVLAVFGVAALVVALLGAVLRRRLPEDSGHIQEIPAYALPRLGALLRETWLRSREILTIVTPLLVAGSVLLALLAEVGADRAVDAVLSPLTHGWLGLPVALGVPLLFGVLRKELSLVMIYQALGNTDLAATLTPVQIFTFLVFLTLYVPCLSTFAVMVKAVGRREAAFSVLLSVGVALAAGGVVRFALAPFWS